MIRYLPRSSLPGRLRLLVRRVLSRGVSDVGARRALVDAHRLVIDGRTRDAIAAVHAVLASHVSAGARAVALTILGDCAESDAEFGHAAQLFAMARAAHLRADAETWVHPAHLRRALAVLDAKRAFVLAATDRFDEAEAVLAETPSSSHAVAIVERAQSLLHFKRDRFEAALALCGGATLDASPLIGPRNLALLRAIARRAKAALGGPYRGEAIDPHVEDDETSRWIEAALGRR